MDLYMLQIPPVPGATPGALPLVSLTLARSHQGIRPVKPKKIWLLEKKP
jgi:hypothetical protein